VTLRRLVVKCESCFQKVTVEYTDNIPERVVKHATQTKHRLSYPWCRAKRPKLLWVSDEAVKE